MPKTALTERLQKSKKKKSISISVRFPREQVETLSEIEERTSVRYDTLIREMITQFLRIWQRTKPRIVKPLYVLVLSYDEALERGLIDPEGNIKEKKKGSK